jgi:hypothetical protein
MRSKYILVKGSVTIDDDLDYSYLRIWAADEWDEHLSAAKEYFAEWEKRDEADLMLDDELKWYSIYHDFDDYKDSFKVFELSAAELKMLKKFGLEYFGQDILV